MNDDSSLVQLLNRMFLISNNSKLLRSTVTFTLSFILGTMTRKQSQTLILITDKMFVDGDNNHV